MNQKIAFQTLESVKLLNAHEIIYCQADKDCYGLLKSKNENMKFTGNFGILLIGFIGFCLSCNQQNISHNNSNSHETNLLDTCTQKNFIDFRLTIESYPSFHSPSIITITKQKQSIEIVLNDIKGTRLDDSLMEESNTNDCKMILKKELIADEHWKSYEKVDTFYLCTKEKIALNDSTFSILKKSMDKYCLLDRKSCLEQGLLDGIRFYIKYEEGFKCNKFVFNSSNEANLPYTVIKFINKLLKTHQGFALVEKIVLMYPWRTAEKVSL